MLALAAALLAALLVCGWWLRRRSKRALVAEPAVGMPAPEVPAATFSVEVPADDAAKERVPEHVARRLFGECPKGASACRRVARMSGVMRAGRGF